MTLPLPTLGCTVDASGIRAPAYSDIVASLQASLAAIYGSDVYLGNDSQDGQLLAIYAKGISDANQATIAAYASFRPSYAQGAALSSLVKLNGIARLVASSSQVDLLVGGDVGTVITDGVATDAAGNRWNLPPAVTIPRAGELTVTASCSAAGAVSADIGTITTIGTPTYGWRTVTNPSAASPGAPVESDAALRQRQGRSVALPANTALEATVAAVAALAGVTKVKAYENDTGTADPNTLPPHSIALVVQGGNATAIATAIMRKKTPGCFTYGTTAVPVVDAYGVTHNIGFFVPAVARLTMTVSIRALAGYSSAVGQAIINSLSGYINSTLNIGDPVYYFRLPLPAQLYGNAAAGSGTFELVGLTVGLYPGAGGTADILIPFNAQASLLPADISLAVS